MIGVPRTHRSVVRAFAFVIASMVVCGFKNGEQTDPSLSGVYALETAGAARGSQTNDAHAATKDNRCNDPRLVAAKTLAAAKMFDEAEAVIGPLLSDRVAAACAALTAVAIETQKRSAMSYLRPFEAGADAALRWILWTLGMLSPLAILALIGVLWRVNSYMNRRIESPRWSISRMTDNSSLGVAETWRLALNDFESEIEASLGLLSREVELIPQALIIGGGGDSGLSDIITNAPNIRGVSTSWLASFLMWILRKCQSPRRTIEVDVHDAGDKSIILRVSIITAKNERRSAAMAAAWNSDGDALAEIEKLATRMAIRTNYMLAGPASAGQVDAKIRLHDGVERLNAYVTKYESHALKEAARAFAETRRLDPKDINAALYEGVARELMEDHERAASLFQLAIDRTKSGSPIQSRARYNLAISYLRRYTSDDLERAEDILEELISDPNVRPSELKHFARAGLANVIAHRFIFWNVFSPGGPAKFDKWSKEKKTKKRDQLKRWSDRINSLVKETRKALSSLMKFQEDFSARTQLEWLVQNACGNHALNRAKNAAKPAGIDDPNARKKVLEEALDAFRRCEALVPAGVETLTNIATTLLTLDRPTEAMQYTKQARDLNAAYEYAYYREAQALRACGETKKCVELLNDANATLEMIAIPGFRGIFKELDVNYHVR